MTEIPDDILAASAAVFQASAPGLFSPSLQEAIARAILAERERCAEITKRLAAGARIMSKDASRFNKSERRDFETMMIAYVCASGEIIRSPAKTEEPAP